MFFSNPVLDMQITTTLLILSAIVAVIVFAVSRKIFKTLVVFSVLANLSFLVNIGSRMFISFGLLWLQYFSLIIWPVINIFLIIKYNQRKNAKNK